MQKYTVIFHAPSLPPTENGTNPQFPGIQYHGISGAVVPNRESPEFSTTKSPAQWYQPAVSKIPVPRRPLPQLKNLRFGYLTRTAGPFTAPARRPGMQNIHSL